MTTKEKENELDYIGLDDIYAGYMEYHGFVEMSDRSVMHNDGRIFYYWRCVANPQRIMWNADVIKMCNREMRRL